MPTIKINGQKIGSFGEDTVNSLMLEDGTEFISDDGVFVPGFIDIHCHGAAGIDVNTADFNGLIKIGEYLAENGVTAWVPTLVPDSDENYRRIIDVLDRVMREQNALPVAQVLGVHYEGVFANEAMCGALRPEFFKRYNSSADIGSLPVPEKGIRMTTLAPEIDNGISLVSDLASQGWVVSIGHTKAPVEVLNRAFEAGAKHLTHFFNAMTGIHHRELGVAGWALSKPDATFDIIADGIHVHPEMLKMAVDIKTPGRVSLISDSIAPTGLGDGEFEVWGESIEVSNGRTCNRRGSIAGSVITMHDAVKMMLSLGFSHAEVSEMASHNPARLLGLDSDCGSIETGKRADLVLLGSDLSIEKVIIGGLVA